MSFAFRFWLCVVSGVDTYCWAGFVILSESFSWPLSCCVLRSSYMCLI